MNHRVTPFILLFSLCSLYALEWPVEQPVFSRLFGQRIHSTTFEQGIVFDNAEMVRSSDTGMLLMTIEKKNRMRHFPSTLGNAFIFSHEDGLQTVYGNLESTGLLKNRTHVEMGNAIGKTGHTGWGRKGDLLFQVIDREKQVFINPQLLLPGITDTVKPAIQTVFLEDSEGQRIPVNQQKSIQKGSYGLYAEITDTVSEGQGMLNVFRVSIFVNGVNIRILPFETMNPKEGSLCLGATALTDTLLFKHDDAVYLGNVILNRGRSDIVITARDINGNERSETFAVQVD